MHAAVILRTSPHYRKDAVVSGLLRCGYQVGDLPRPKPRPDDVLVIWNRWKTDDFYAKRYVAAGAKVIVLENPYVSPVSGEEFFAAALTNHNGAGTWYQGGPERWASFGIELKPWRRTGGEILVLPQRGIGAPGVAMPADWVADVTSRLRQVTDRKIRVRPHPGAARTDPAEDLKAAWAAVTWASGAGIKSIIHGVPVFHDMAKWIGAPAARCGLSEIETPFVGDRLPMLERLAWAQFSASELQTGEAIRMLLG